MTAKATATAAAARAAYQHNNPLNVRLMDLEGVAADEGCARLLDRAAELHASDLFLVTNEQHIAAQIRRLGVIEPLSILSLEQGKRYIAHVRAEAGMNVADHRRPHDGRWLHARGGHGVGGAPIDLRISVIPTLHGEDLAIRLLDRDLNLLALERLGMTPQQLEGYRKLLDRPGGMILFAGPTGTGKTVTLYGTLAELNDGRRKIHTIEDPVEYAIDGLRQSQVNPLIRLGAEELLRGVLRQSPDVVMVGEVRDAETAETAVWAANSGVTVLSTVHAPTAADAVPSMRGFGIAPVFIGASLRAAVSQRLVRTLCPHCREPASNGDEVHVALRDVEPHLNGHAEVLYEAQGCEQCHFSGFGGRTGVFEVMPITPAVRELIVRGAPSRDLRRCAVEQGMLTLRQAALLKVAQGKTTLEEVRRCIPVIEAEEAADA